ncbi:basic proline-rich protein-like [Eubalaena glacialis]|uniref:basic proline-rich protein-like n=1 Tax=Eubalaena glacialis TaxID=27606 RepID=UPI002A598EEC|nr:basic proline-rich protein-like [Eubalaena glacialis]
MARRPSPRPDSIHSKDAHPAPLGCVQVKPISVNFPTRLSAQITRAPNARASTEEESPPSTGRNGRPDSRLQPPPRNPDGSVRCAPASRQESGSVYTSVFRAPPNQKSTHSDKALIFQLCQGAEKPHDPSPPRPPPPGAANPTKPDQKPSHATTACQGEDQTRERAGAGRRGGGRDPEPGAGTLGSGWARVAPVRGLRPPVAPRSPGGGEVGRPRYLEDQGGPRPGSHLRRAPPARPPAPIHPDASRAPVGARSPRARVGGARRRSAESGSRSSNGDARRLGLSARGAGAAGGAGPGGRRDAGDAGAPGSGRSGAQTEPRPALGAPLRGPGHSGAHSHPDSHPAPPRRGAPGGGGSAPAPPPPRPPLAQVSPPGPRHPGRAPRSAGRRARRPSPRPPGARPEIAGLPTSKGRPAHQSARAARRLGLALTRGPRARSAPRPRGRPGQGLGPGPRIGSPPRPRAPPGRSRRRGTWGSRTAGEGVRGTRRRGRGQRRAPPPLFLRKIRVGLAPAAAALGPSGPRPARLSTRAPLPAATPGTQRPPGASNKNCAVDFTVHFKGASRRTVLKGRYAPAALRAAPGPPPPLSGAVRLAAALPAASRPGRTPSRALRPRRGWARPRPRPGGARLGSGSAGAAPPPPPFTAQLSPGETGASDARRPGDP